MPPPLVLFQNVHLGVELGVRLDAPRLRQHHPPLDLRLLHPPQQQAHVVTGHALIEQLAEHFHTGADGLLGVAETDDFDFVTGKVEQGKVNTGDEIEIVGLRDTQKTVCTGVEMFRKLLDEGQAGDNIGALLRGTKKEDVERGQVLCKPGSITPHTQFEGQVYVLKKEEGGRHKPFFNNYRPQFFFRTTDVTGTIQLPAGTEMVMPGDNVVMTVELGKPIAMDEGLRFAIREGGRTVGAGRVTKILK